MFRGEPIALWTLFIGFLWFIGVQLLGLIITGIIDVDFPLTTQSHFFIAYFGWIGFVMLGAQLQFYRAITGLRKYSPTFLRYMYLIFLVLGMGLMIYGSYARYNQVVACGLFTYLLGVLIHSYWIIKQSRSKYFKFPLDYMFVSNLILILSLILLFLSISADEYYLVNRSTIRHMLSIGWISLTLQGALVRILPMFVGQSIDRGARIHLKGHFIFCTFASVIFSFSFVLENTYVVSLTGFLWFLSWVWTLNILRKSIVRKSLEYKQTLLFIAPGLFWFVIGSFLGFYIAIQDKLNTSTNFRALHIHISLLLGSTLIMLGALHRITTFQIYTLLYTGKRQQSITLKHMLRLRRLTVAAISFNISVVYMAYGFVDNNFRHVGIGGLLILFSTTVYSTIIFQNLYHYIQNKRDAIPFWLKPTEYDASKTESINRSLHH